MRTVISNWEWTWWPLDLIMANFTKTPQIFFSAPKNEEVEVQISYSAWNSFWICDIRKTLQSTEESELVNGLEQKWWLLVWFTSEEWIIPKYITDMVEINNSNIELQPRFLQNGAQTNQQLVFVRKSAVVLAKTKDTLLDRVKRLLAA